MPSRTSSMVPYKKKRTYKKKNNMGGPYQTTGWQRTWPNASGMGQIFDPFPAKITAKMRYSEEITLTSIIGLSAHHLFRANSIFDPNLTGIGHQPYGHDVYQQIYNHYEVTNATIVVSCHGSGTEGCFGVSLVDDAVISSDYNSVREQKGTRMAFLVPEKGICPQVVNYYNQNQNFPMEYRKATNSEFGSSPADGMNFDIWVCGSSLLSAGSDFRFNVAITYTVKMWELKDLGGS